MRISKFSSITVLLAVAGAATLAAPAQANILSDLRRSISSLWGQHSARQGSAQTAYRRATTINNNAGALHERLENTQRTLLEANDIYDNYLRQLHHTEARIVRTRHRIRLVSAQMDQHRTQFGARLAAMQRTGRTGYLGIFLGSHSISDLAWRGYVFQTLTQRDTQLQQDLKDDKAQLVGARNSLAQEWSKRHHLEHMAGQERQRIALVAGQQHTILQQLYNDRGAQLAYAQAQQHSSDDITTLIARLTSRRDAELERLSQREATERLQWWSSRSSRRYKRYSRRYARSRRNGRALPQLPQNVTWGNAPSSPRQIAPWSPIGSPTVPEAPVREEGEDWSGAPTPGANGTWSLPLRGHLSSRFGMRYHPILHRVKLHTGDDLAAPYGTPFRAARGGRVLYSGWKTAYGNTLIIDDGNGTVTLYGHASHLQVHAGQMVHQGQTIGNVGSTGYSTGPHLHFEVRQQGRAVDPTRYLRGH